jgi:hypothetical protein
VESVDHNGGGGANGKGHGGNVLSVSTIVVVVVMIVLMVVGVVVGVYWQCSWNSMGARGGREGGSHCECKFRGSQDCPVFNITRDRANEIHSAVDVLEEEVKAAKDPAGKFHFTCTICYFVYYFGGGGGVPGIRLYHSTI